jgi:hypothetical protein
MTHCTINTPHKLLFKLQYVTKTYRFYGRYIYALYPEGFPLEVTHNDKLYEALCHFVNHPYALLIFSKTGGLQSVGPYPAS